MLLLKAMQKTAAARLAIQANLSEFNKRDNVDVALESRLSDVEQQAYARRLTQDLECLESRYAGDLAQIVEHLIESKAVEEAWVTGELQRTNIVQSEARKSCASSQEGRENHRKKKSDWSVHEGMAKPSKGANVQVVLEKDLLDDERDTKCIDGCTGGEEGFVLCNHCCFWFHLQCFGLVSAPVKGNWYCSDTCRQKGPRICIPIGNPSEDWDNEQLKAYCKYFALKTSGNKEELLARLQGRIQSGLELWGDEKNSSSFFAIRCSSGTATTK